MRFLIIHVGLVVEGGLASLWYGVGFMYMWDWGDDGFGSPFGCLVCLLGHSHECMCVLILFGL